MKGLSKENYNSTKQMLLLSNDWSLFKTSPNQYSSPEEFTLSEQSILSAKVPSTVAMALNNEESDCWTPPFDYDDFDWWYHYDFNSLDEIKIQTNSINRLCFDGLATLCDIWLNGNLILSTDNMFRSYSIDLENKLNGSDELFLVFRSISENLNRKRPRPRWKTKLVENQQMRWIRSTVLGHVSVWTPPIKCIGPWKGIYLETIKNITIAKLDVITSVIENDAVINVNTDLKLLNDNEKVTKAEIIINQQTYQLEIEQKKSLCNISTKQILSDIEFWWPHTHGTPNLYEYEVIVQTTNGNYKLDAGKLGFKSVEFNITAKKSELQINKQLIFCRGTCWTVSDYLSLNADKAELTKILRLMRDSGLNMVRVGGTMVYESDHFYQLCDELGIMVWQDFMFASMDYPIEDDNFFANVKAEINQQLNRFNRHVSITTYCGNTDVEAQAAMYGMPKELWSNELFSNFLPDQCRDKHPDIPYLASSPTGGVLPFHLSSGVTHYWGIGAYMHEAKDADMTRVRFASEGMGLSHIPEDETIVECIGKNSLYPYNNEWIKRIPRDLGAGWDFDDVRDYYLNQIFDVDPIKVRRHHVQRYIELSRVITGEMLAQVFQFWRSFDSQCNGGLIWFNRDFWPCAGFGIIDSNNRPKPAYYQLKRVWSNQTAILKNEGLDGVSATVINETNNELDGSLEIELIKGNQTSLIKVSEEINLKAHSKLSLNVDKILGRFYDTGYAYQFGEPQFDIMACRLIKSDGTEVSENFLFPHSQSLPKLQNAQIIAHAKQVDQDTIELTITSDRFLQFVRIVSKGYRAEDNYFHLSPEREKRIRLTKVQDETTLFKGKIEAINLCNSFKIIMQEAV
jgi:beta-mannosidase